MSYLSRFTSQAEALLRSRHFIARKNNSWCTPGSCVWNRTLGPAIASVNPRKLGARFCSKASPKSAGPAKTSRSKKKKKATDPEPEMEKEKGVKAEAFYVVRRGDAIGLYTSLDDCQAQVGSSICDSPISVFKGYDLPKSTEDYLASRGLKNALYSINAGDMKEGLFGTLVQCSLTDPASAKDSSKKRSQLEAELQPAETLCSISTKADLSQKYAKLSHPETSASSNYKSCIIKFDGACKGNPGKGGAGAVLQATNGSLICTLREGCGETTNNVAEYRALRLGLKFALEKGFKSVSVQGDSKLVCMQVLGLWKAKSANLASLLEEVMNLKKQFVYFEMFHVMRDLNSDVDAVANKAVALHNGEIVEETPA